MGVNYQSYIVLTLPIPNFFLFFIFVFYFCFIYLFICGVFGLIFRWLKMKLCWLKMLVQECMVINEESSSQESNSYRYKLQVQF